MNIQYFLLIKKNKSAIKILILIETKSPEVYYLQGFLQKEYSYPKYAFNNLLREF